MASPSRVATGGWPGSRRALCIVAGVIVIIAHQEVVSKGGGVDHSLGPFVAAFGYLVMAVACAAAALTHQQVAATRDSIDRFMNWRPGLPVAVAGFVATLIAMTYAAWFSPQRLEAKFPDLHTLFSGYGLAPLAMQFTIWLGWALLAAGTITAVVASYLRHRALAWVAAMLGVVGVVLTLITLYGISKIGADNNVDSASRAVAEPRFRRLVGLPGVQPAGDRGGHRRDRERSAVSSR